MGREAGEGEGKRWDGDKACKKNVQKEKEGKLEKEREKGKVREVQKEVRVKAGEWESHTCLQAW